MGGATQAAAIVFALVTTGAITFQVALALGAPLGGYAMGGRSPGRFPTPLRIAAVVQAVVLGILALIVLSGAGLVLPTLAVEIPWLPWSAVVFSALSLVVNANSPSAKERRIWVPVAIVLLTTSVVVALSGG